ncbi:acyltransferase [Mucilaginibacter terrenus]|uniref:Acyltransferase n=1 Tax=Mucilaginibacter terrenus TaxID=2482727 RepID=A0A3E2NR96_9SPHI|nr:acyltransferase [Mucilaginibacter terrenus]RFZ83461.1 acyltransferase [Mucilaginibacter terrenus]
MADAVKPQKKSRVYFPNLNGVRAIAALLVVIAHIELGKQDFHLTAIDFFPLTSLGRVGVSIFFSLSGFLITYLLLEEKLNFQKVSMPAFYMRRILRIWPLYYVVVFIGLLVYWPHAKPFVMAIFFLPNLAFALKIIPALFDPIWSIGTEEQFYIFHPHFFKFKTTRQIFHALIIFMIAFLALVQVIRHFQHRSDEMHALSQLTYYMRFDNMMMGAIVAVIYFNTKHQHFKFKLQGFFNLMFNKYVQVLLSLALLAVIYLYIVRNMPEGDLFIAAIAALLIVNLCETETSIYNLTNKKLMFIGEISYGIYLLHKFPVYLMLWLTKNYMPNMNYYLQNVIIYVASYILAIMLAALSYYTLEKYFLNLKKRFAKITQH